jgi:serine protease Do
VFRTFLASLALILAGFAAGIVVTGRAPARGEFAPENVAAPIAEAAAPAAVGAGSTPDPAAQPPTATGAAAATAGPDFTRVAGQAVRAVANISSVQVVRRRNTPYFEDPFFRYFFGDQDAFGPPSRRSLSLGSGVVVSADGYVVTNNHVVGENVARVTVALGDKREIEGTIVGTDPATDIALLKLDVSGLPVLAWGDSSRLQVGEWVLAIGSPFQLSQTVTAGIVSATGRSNVGFTDYEDFIQTDAAINPGNSGGALVNTRGELVGINTGIFSQSGGYQGIGFAVPSNLARHVVDDLRQYGEVRRGTIEGILQVDTLTARMAAELGAPNTNGGLLTRMSSRDSAAYRAGLRAGDIIVAFNGQAIADPSQLFRLVADARIGSTATVTVLREGRKVEIRVPITSASTTVRR